jgi:hypothetical protein
MQSGLSHKGSRSLVSKTAQLPCFLAENGQPFSRSKRLYRMDAVLSTEYSGSQSTGLTGQVKNSIVEKSQTAKDG